MGTEVSTLGNQKLEKATEELEKRRKKKLCISQKTMTELLEKMKIRQTQVSTTQISKMRKEAAKAGHLQNYKTDPRVR